MGIADSHASIIRKIELVLAALRTTVKEVSNTRFAHQLHGCDVNRTHK